MADDDRILRKLNFMQRCVGYLKSIDTDSMDLEADYE